MRRNLRNKIILKFSIIGIFSFILSCFTFPHLECNAELHMDSDIQQAREPVSQLDFILYKRDLKWNRSFYEHPSDQVKKNYPLITKCKVIIDSSFKSNLDQIHVRGHVMDTNAFLELNRKDRKQLAEDILMTFLMDISLDVCHAPKENELIRKELKRKEIIIDIRIDRITRGILPNRYQYGASIFGLAGYYNGEFIFSKIYLEPRPGLYKGVSDEKMKSKLKEMMNEFVIEKDPYADKTWYETIIMKEESKTGESSLNK